MPVREAWRTAATEKTAGPAKPDSWHRDDGSPYRGWHPDRSRTGQGGEIQGSQFNDMREIVFLVTAEQPGRIEATAPDLGLQVEAPTLEELHHEARDALIRKVGPSHATYRIRIRRAGHPPLAANDPQPAKQHPLQKSRPVRAAKASGEGFGAPGRTVTPRRQASLRG